MRARRKHTDTRDTASAQQRTRKRAREQTLECARQAARKLEQMLDARPRADELKELSRQLAIEATRAETLARRAGPAAEDSVWPGRQAIETFGDEAVPVGVDDIAEV